MSTAISYIDTREIYTPLSGMGPVEIGSYKAYISGSMNFSKSMESFLQLHLSALGSTPGEFISALAPWEGSYALVFVDRASRCAYLVTDFLGSRPIYYAQTPSGWAWSFRLAPLVRSIGNRSIDLDALDEVFLHRWLMTDRTLFGEIRQVPPSHCVCLYPGRPPTVTRYASIEFQPAGTRQSLDELVERTNAGLDSYFSRLRHAHSRIAIFFSGGVDSGLLVAKAREHDFERVTAVTAHYPGHPNPEAERARKVAAHLGIDLRVVEVTDDFVRRSLPDVISLLERPATYLNTLARLKIFEELQNEAEFFLTGEAADCLFGSEMLMEVARYQAKQRLIGWLPRALRQLLASAVDRPGSLLARRLGSILEHSTLDHIRRLGTQDRFAAAGRTSSQELVPVLRNVRAGTRESRYRMYETDPTASLLALCQNVILYTSNRNQFLSYSLLGDSCGMSVGFPFLSPEILRIGLHLPDSSKMDAHGTKPILKRLAERFIPHESIYGRKLGFDVPAEQWISGPLSEWRRLLSEERTRSRGLFDGDVLERLDSKRDWPVLWAAIGVEVFLRAFLDDGPGWSARPPMRTRSAA
jgi:asparagine synthase (glutamine-hydrolysing)